MGLKRKKDITVQDTHQNDKSGLLPHRSFVEQLGFIVDREWSGRVEARSYEIQHLGSTKIIDSEPLELVEIRKHLQLLSHQSPIKEKKKKKKKKKNPNMTERLPFGKASVTCLPLKKLQHRKILAFSPASILGLLYFPFVGLQVKLFFFLRWTKI